MAGSAPTFTVKEWQSIVADHIRTNEERMRECRRWTGASILALAALGSVYLTQAPAVNWGASWLVSIILLTALVYLFVRLSWILLYKEVFRLTFVLLAPKPGGPPTRTLWERAERALKPFLRAPFSNIAFVSIPTVGITLLLAVAYFSMPTSSASTTLLRLVEFRSVVVALGVALFAVMSVARRHREEITKELKQRIEKIAKNPPKRLENVRKHRRIIRATEYVSAAIYYGAQLWLVWAVLVTVVPMSFGLAVMALLELAILVVVIWAIRIAWEFLAAFSRIVGLLKDVESKILLGELSTPDAVAVELAPLLRKPV